MSNPFESISDKEWLTFFDVLDRITNAEGSWKKKAEELKLMAEKYESDTALQELIEWYQSDED